MARKLKDYQLRALSELSYRSLNTVKSNLKTLKNKKDKRVLTKALNLTKRKTRRRKH